MTRFDGLPAPQRLFVELYGWAVASLLYVFFGFLRRTSSLKILDERSPENATTSAVWASWHEDVVLNFIFLPMIVARSTSQVWLTHPAWIMRPIHRLLELYGVEMIMAASGQGGKRGADDLARRLQQGASTVINPDGPAGPKHVLKPGVIQLAQVSHLPIIAMRYKFNYCWHWPGWDRKRVPPPFAGLELELKILEPEPATNLAERALAELLRS